MHERIKHKNAWVKLPEIAICSSMVQLEEQPGCRSTAHEHLVSSDNQGLAVDCPPTLRLQGMICKFELVFSSHSLTVSSPANVNSAT